MSFVDSHPGWAAVIAVAVGFIILGRIALKALKAQQLRTGSMLKHLDKKLSVTEGRLYGGVKGMSQAVSGAADTLSRVSDSMETRQERMRREITEQLTGMQQASDRRLDAIASRLGRDVNEALESRLGESFRLVSGQLESVYKGLGEMQALAQDVGDLKRVLSGVKTRGVWGEVRLRALLEQDLPRSAWIENACVKRGSQERVEFAVRMPGRDQDAPVLLPIDSKFPMEAHARLLASREKGDAEEEKRCKKALENALVEEAKRISSKYIDPPSTTDFALMFLPTEGLYAEALSSPGLTEAMLSRFRVLPAGPSNLSALLSCLQMGFRTLAVEKRSGEIMDMLSGVRKEFDAFGEIIDRARSRLEQAAGELDGVGARSRALNKKLVAMEQLRDESGTETPAEKHSEQIMNGRSESE